MEREILFRGKRTDNHQWVLGSLLLEGTGTNRNPYIVNDKGKYRVAHKTISQYTGLADNNGVKVFEGDIISIPFEEDRSPYEENCIYYESGTVYFCAEHHGWYVQFKDDSLSIWEYDETDFVVVGNIHDNPELFGNSEQLEE